LDIAATLMLETTKAEQLHRAPKVIEEPLVWKPTRQGFRLEVPVWCPELEEDLRLVCSVGKTNYGFSILYQNHPIRRYDSCSRHKSHSTGEVINRTPHKHTWSKENEDDQAYIPDDIDPKSDINTQLLEFLKEENIEARGGYQRLMS
jgi:hypothetical protein